MESAQRHEFAKHFSVKAATFDPSTGNVAVEFRSGETRTYAGFSAEEFATWCTFDKPGQWFADNVRQRPGLHPLVPDLALAEPVARRDVDLEPVVAPTPIPEPPTAEPGPAAPAPPAPADRRRYSLARARASRQPKGE